MRQRHNSLLPLGVLLCDLVLTLGALPSAAALRLVLDWGKPITALQVLVPWQLYIAVAGIWLVVFVVVRPHHAVFAETVVDTAGKLLTAVVLAVMVLAGTLFLSFRDLSRLQFAFFAAIDLLALLALHLGVRFLAPSARGSDWQRRVLLVGSGPQAQQFLHELADHRSPTLYVVGCTSDDAGGSSAVPVLGPIQATARVAAAERIDEVIFAIPEQEAITRLALEMSTQPVALHVVPNLLDLAFTRMPLENVGGIGLVSLQEPALTSSQLMLKRIFDIIGSGLLLLLCSPLLIAVAIAIKLDSPGSIFFRQERIGTRGRRFTMIKFRTMVEGAEEQWTDAVLDSADGGVIHKRVDDPRVTRVGRTLRRSSIDELPQLINVLRGEMSLVGPRPELPKIAAAYAPWQWQRFRVPAGMTGWWQVNGRSANPMHLHTDDDMYYIQNYSFWLDLKILWMTIPAVLKGQGAF